MTGNDNKRSNRREQNKNYDSENEGSDQDEITFYEETSESEPENECEIWDNDCKILSNFSPQRHIGCHLMATCSTDPEVHPKKRIKLSPSLRSDLNDSMTIRNIQKFWIDNLMVCQNDNIELLTNPFKLCIIKNFLQNESVLHKIREEFYELNFNLRNMDLYEFFQSKDLKYLTSTEQIRSIYDFLKNDIMEWVSTITGYDLTHISTTCSLYSNTDYLLVHDDQREDRMVAFILYLTDHDGWQKKHGGSLQLFSKDKNSQPFEVVKDVFPANNQFIFFPVTNDSYHQVAEVTGLNRYRLSINGWFHTKKPPVFDIPLYQPLDGSLYSNKTSKPKVVDIDLESWINDDYLEVNSIKLIQKHIEENSEISLKNFLRRESFGEILQNLQSDDINWKKVGPSNRISYEFVDLENIPHVIERFLDLFQSTLMFQLLQKYTDLELDTDKASVKFELQRWTPGNYALLTEYDWKEKNELDLIMYFGCKKSSDVIGARTHYVTIEDEVQNALITIEPEENNLNVVYRDSARFTKYFSKQSICQCFYTLMCSYSE